MIDDPRMDPADLRSASFPGSFRRYDARAVDEFLTTVAERVAETNALVDDLRRQLLEARSDNLEASAAGAADEAPDLRNLTDDELVRLVGDETAHVLTTARHAADEIRTKAEEAAARMIREATAEANRSQEEAEQRVAELTTEAEGARDAAVAAAEVEAEGIRAEAAADAERTISEAAEQASAVAEQNEAARVAAEEEVARIIADARDEGARMIDEAKDVRRQILGDLRRRRDLGRAQVERLATGRDALLAAYDDVRANLDEITARLAEVLPDPAVEAEPLPEIPEIPELDEDVSAEDVAHSGGAERDASGFTGIVGAKAAEDDSTEDAPPVDAGADTGVLAAEDEIAAADSIPEPDPDLPAVDTATGEQAEGGAEIQEPLQEPDEAEAPDEADGAGAVDPSASGEEDTAGPADDAEEAGVDALFARIRAERAESVARAQEILAVDRSSDAEPAVEQPDVDGPDAVVAATAADGVEPDEQDGDVERVPPALLATGPVWEHRNEAVAALDKKLSRALKRVLSDEQNEVLDALRRTESTSLSDLLPDLDDHVAAYAAAARPHLSAAASAGASQVDPDVPVDGGPLADVLGRTLVEPFRRRIERTAADVEGDADELDERLRAVYREWKVEHIGGATRDALLDAYAHGQHTAAPALATLRWLIDPAQGPCPDAQDNALAGEVQKGTTFPTGDDCPQAHPGCLCLLAVD